MGFRKSGYSIEESINIGNDYQKEKIGAILKRK